MHIHLHIAHVCAWVWVVALASIHAHVSVYIYIYMDVYVHLPLCIYVYIYIYMYTHAHTNCQHSKIRAPHSCKVRVTPVLAMLLRETPLHALALHLGMSPKSWCWSPRLVLNAWSTTRGSGPGTAWEAAFHDAICHKVLTWGSNNNFAFFLAWGAVVGSRLPV